MNPGRESPRENYPPHHRLIVRIEYYRNNGTPATRRYTRSLTHSRCCRWCWCYRTVKIQRNNWTRPRTGVSRDDRDIVTFSSVNFTNERLHVFLSVHRMCFEIMDIKVTVELRNNALEYVVGQVIDNTRLVSPASQSITVVVEIRKQLGCRKVGLSNIASSPPVIRTKKNCQSPCGNDLWD